MTKPVRNRLSTAAWAATIFCSVLLLVSAFAAASHKSGITVQQQEAIPAN
jgi:hypothetical protein